MYSCLDEILEVLAEREHIRRLLGLSLCLRLGLGATNGLLCRLRLRCCCSCNGCCYGSRLSYGLSNRLCCRLGSRCYGSCNRLGYRLCNRC